jgi:hypothetical protein
MGINIFCITYRMAHIDLHADRRSGQFLSQSVLSDSVFLGASPRKHRPRGGAERAHLTVRHVDMPLQPAGTQVGTIGTDLLPTLKV